MTAVETDLVYASKVARLPVLDPEDVAVGRIADIVVGPLAHGHPPPVLGFVVAVPGRRIFLSAGRVAALEADGARLRGGAINLRRFAPRPSERLIVRDLFDSQVPATAEVVNDVALAPVPHRRGAWEVVAVDLVPAGRLRGRRRRGRRRTAPWREVRELFSDSGDSFAHLRDLHPVEVAERLQELAPRDRLAAARALDDDQLADLLEELPETVQAELLDTLGLERAADVLEAMAPDDAADLLAEVAEKRRIQLLEAMEPDEAEPLRRLLRYSPDTAGGMMTPEPVIVEGSATVAEALARLRDPDLPAAVAAQVFVVDPPTETPTGSYRGVCSVPQLLRERPGVAVVDCIAEGPQPVAPGLSHALVAERLAAYNLLALPVCDSAKRLLGAVTVDDVIDRLLPAGWRER